MKAGTYERYQAVPPESVALPADYAQNDGGTAVYWLGAAGVLINSRGTLIMVDPVLALRQEDPAVSEIGEALLRLPPVLAEQVERLDAVLYTHTDDDHLAPRTAQKLLPSGAVYHGTPYVERELDKLGVPAQRRAAHLPGESFRVGEVEVTLTPAFHPHQLGNLDFTGWFKPEDCCGYRIATQDGVLWIPGDSILMPEHLQMQGIDLLFIDFGDNAWHFGLECAIGLANVYESAQMIPFHWGTFYAPDKPWQNADPASVVGSLRRPERLHILAPGQKYVLSRR